MACVLCRRDGLHELDASDMFWFSQPGLLHLAFQIAYFLNSLSIAITCFTLAQVGAGGGGRGGGSGGYNHGLHTGKCGWLAGRLGSIWRGGAYHETGLVLGFRA